MSLRDKFDSLFYPEFENNWDDKLFRDYIEKEINPESIILDLGAGAGIVKEMNFKGYGKKVCGVDLDKRVLTNPFLDEGKVADANGIPYPDETFDIVFSDNVLEHLEDPLKVFREVNRVLKPGGLYLFKTPNKWHYMPIIARLTPHVFHQFVNKFRGKKRIEDDVFPTIYRANSKGDISKLIKQSGFELSYIKMIEGRPEYLRMIWPTYLVGLIYERFVNLSSIFSMFRILIIGCAKKFE